MKKIALPILCILAVIFVHAQTITISGKVYQKIGGRYYYNEIGSRQNLYIPQDTLDGPPGSIAVLHDTVFYSKSNSGVWNKVASGSGVGGTANIRVKQFPTKVRIDSVAGSSTDIPAADTLNAGVMDTTMARKMRKLEPVANVIELRTLGSDRISLNTIYQIIQNKVIGSFVWNPTSVRTDDSVMTIKVAGITTGRFERFYTNYIDIRWFVNPDSTGGTNYQDAAFRKATNFILKVDSSRNPILQIDGSAYDFRDGWLVANFYGGSYHAVTIHVRGSSNFVNDRYGTVLFFHNKQKFGIGQMIGKGCEWENLQIIGQFTPPSTSGPTFYNTSFASWNDATCIDNHYATHLGFSLEPYGNNGTPAGGGYAATNGLTYTSNGENGGSTGTYIHNVRFDNWVVAFASSINGWTLNAELTHIADWQVVNSKVAIAVCHDQEKGCVSDRLQTWQTVYRIIDQGSYGLGPAGNWTFNGINAAGAVNQLMNWTSGNYEPFSINHLFAESLGYLGNATSYVGSAFHDCDINFSATAERGNMASFYGGMPGVTFTNCVFKKQGDETQLTFYGDSHFINCSFEKMPLTWPLINSGSGNATFENCFVGAATTPFGQRLAVMNPVITNHLPGYGNFTITGTTNYRFGEKDEWTVKNPLPTLQTFTTASRSVVKVGTQFKVYVAEAEKYKFDSAGLVVVNNGSDVEQVMGIATRLHQTTDSITISYSPTEFTSGTYYIGCSHQIYFDAAFIGDVTSGSRVVANPVIDFGNFSLLPGTWIRMPGVGGTSGLSQPGNGYSDYMLVDSLGAAGLYFHIPFTYTATGVSFTSNSTKRVDYFLPAYNLPGATEPFLLGTKIVYSDGSIHDIVTAGFGGASSDTRKATYTPINSIPGLEAVMNVSSTGIHAHSVTTTSSSDYWLYSAGVPYQYVIQYATGRLISLTDDNGVQGFLNPDYPSNISGIAAYPTIGALTGSAYTFGAGPFNIWWLQPKITDGVATAYKFDTYNTLSASNLFDIKNNGTLKLSLSGAGAFTLPYYVAGVTESSDTTNFKPIVVGSDGKFHRTYWPALGGGGYTAAQIDSIIKIHTDSLAGTLVQEVIHQVATTDTTHTTIDTLPFVGSQHITWSLTFHALDYTVGTSGYNPVAEFTRQVGTRMNDGTPSVDWVDVIGNDHTMTELAGSQVFFLVSGGRVLVQVKQGFLIANTLWTVTRSPKLVTATIPH